MNTSPVTLIGNLTADPEIVTLPSGAKKINFSVACEKRWMQDNEWKSETSFFNVIGWRERAENSFGILEKGMRVVIVGTLNQRSYETNEGQKRSVVEVTADEIAVAVWSIGSLTRRQTNSNRSMAGASAGAPDEAPF